MTNAAYATALRQAHALMRLLLELPLGEMRDAINHSEAVGPILDPTLWRRKAGDLQVDKAVVEALATAVSRLQREVPEYREKVKDIEPSVCATVLLMETSR